MVEYGNATGIFSARACPSPLGLFTAQRAHSASLLAGSSSPCICAARPCHRTIATADFGLRAPNNPVSGRSGSCLGASGPQTRKNSCEVEGGKAFWGHRYRAPWAKADWCPEQMNGGVTNCSGRSSMGFLVVTRRSKRGQAKRSGLRNIVCVPLRQVRASGRVKAHREHWHLALRPRFSGKARMKSVVSLLSKFGRDAMGGSCRRRHERVACAIKQAKTSSSVRKPGATMI